MGRLFLLGLLAAAGCMYDAPGTCNADGDCRGGEHCTNGVCIVNGQVPLGGACGVSAECASWASCAAAQCMLRPGACEGESHCAAWQDCADHACVLAPGSCDGEPDCPEWKGCAANACVLDAGRCDAHADCAGWQYCDGIHVCRDVGGTCAVDGDCEAWQACTSGHCANQPGACAIDQHCDPSWQVCSSEHACVAGAGHCASSNDCAAWESCGLDHVCAANLLCTGDTDCLPGESCTIATGTTFGSCAAAGGGYDPRGITIWGDIVEGIGSGVLAPLHAPTRAAPGFHLQWDGWITSSGEFWYKADLGPGSTWQLRKWVRDPWRYVREDDRWAYPYYDSTYQNDPVVPTPACTNVAALVLQAGGDGYLYTCQMTGDPDADKRWYDGAGNLVVDGTRVLSWNGAGVKLLELWDGSRVLIDAQGVETPVTGPSWWSASGYRVQAGGFWIVSGYSTSAYERWSVGLDGVSTNEGIYARPPGDSGSCFFHAIDSAGRIYCQLYVSGSSGRDVVYRCELAPGTCTIVYDENDAPPQNMTVYPPRVFAYLHGGELVTGP